MKKKYILLLVILVFTYCFFLLKNILPFKVIPYSTAFKEINDLLNTEISNFKSNITKNNKKLITLNNNMGVIKFHYYSTLENIDNGTKIVINFKSENNFISILKFSCNKNILSELCFNKFSKNKDGNYVDELDNPIYIFNEENIEIIYCHNLKNNSSRNYFYYDVNKHDITTTMTRANEIFFWYNNYFYYVGIDMNLQYTEIVNLVKTIIQNY